MEKRVDPDVTSWHAANVVPPEPPSLLPLSFLWISGIIFPTLRIHGQEERRRGLRTERRAPKRGAPPRRIENDDWR
ncbi:unnamed protein product, partial [Heterotrigona itama]